MIREWFGKAIGLAAVFLLIAVVSIQPADHKPTYKDAYTGTWENVVGDQSLNFSSDGTCRLGVYDGHSWTYFKGSWAMDDVAARVMLSDGAPFSHVELHPVSKKYSPYLAIAPGDTAPVQQVWIRKE